MSPFLFAALLGPAVPARAAAESPPGVVFVLTDDHRHDHLGCAGHPVLETPNIDALAARGTRFSRAFVTTPICAASRASIFTGLHEAGHRFTFGTPPLRRELVETAYPALMKKAGVRTGFAGKFGVTLDGDPAEDWFDSFEPIDRTPYFKKQPDGTRRHTADLIGDAGVRFVEETPAGTPFCLSLSFNAGHAEDRDLRDHYPHPETEAGLYQDAKLPRPFPVPAAAFGELPHFLRDSMNRDRWQWRWHSRFQYDRNLRDYYRLLTAADRNVGRVVAALEAAGRLDDTLVVVTGDNGMYLGSRGLAGKWSHFDEALRVPLVIAGPGITAGAVREEMVLNVDLPATLLAAFDLKLTGNVSGRDLSPLLAGGSAPADWRTDFLGEHRMDHPRIPKWRGVRGERRVYADYDEQDPPFEFLHDLEADPDERANLADDPAHAADLERMRARRDELEAAATGR